MITLTTKQSMKPGYSLYIDGKLQATVKKPVKQDQLVRACLWHLQFDCWRWFVLSATVEWCRWQVEIPQASMAPSTSVAAQMGSTIDITKVILPTWLCGIKFWQPSRYWDCTKSLLWLLLANKLLTLLAPPLLENHAFSLGFSGKADYLLISRFFSQSICLCWSSLAEVISWLTAGCWMGTWSVRQRMEPGLSAETLRKSNHTIRTKM